jgi:uncharacterized protein (TIGR01777 family)
MRVTVTGATGLIGPDLVGALQGRGDHVTVLARDPERARSLLGDVEAHRWEACSGPPAAQALEGRDAVVHLAGAPVAQRWTQQARREIRESRVKGTSELVDALAAAPSPPGILVCASAVGFYGDRGSEPLDESAAPGSDFLARVCVDWEAAATAAEAHGVRVSLIRTGVVLDAEGGALAKMLPPFKAGVGGPVAGGRQYMPWIHLDDVVGLYLAALDNPAWSGAFNGTAPVPVTNREFSKALGRVLRRPAIAPVPALALRLLYGEMAEIVTGGQNAVPAAALTLGHEFAHTELEPALRDALGRD